MRKSRTDGEVYVLSLLLATGCYSSPSAQTKLGAPRIEGHLARDAGDILRPIARSDRVATITPALYRVLGPAGDILLSHEFSPRLKVNELETLEDAADLNTVWLLPPNGKLQVATADASGRFGSWIVCGEAPNGFHPLAGFRQAVVVTGDNFVIFSAREDSCEPQTHDLPLSNPRWFHDPATMTGILMGIDKSAPQKVGLFAWGKRGISEYILLPETLSGSARRLFSQGGPHGKLSGMDLLRLQRSENALFISGSLDHKKLWLATASDLMHIDLTGSQPVVRHLETTVTGVVAHPDGDKAYFTSNDKPRYITSGELSIPAPASPPQGNSGGPGAAATSSPTSVQDERRSAHALMALDSRRVVGVDGRQIWIGDWDGRIVTTEIPEDSALTDAPAINIHVVSGNPEHRILICSARGLSRCEIGDVDAASNTIKRTPITNPVLGVSHDGRVVAVAEISNQEIQVNVHHLDEDGGLRFKPSRIGGIKTAIPHSSGAGAWIDALNYDSSMEMLTDILNDEELETLYGEVLSVQLINEAKGLDGNFGVRFFSGGEQSLAKLINHPIPIPPDEEVLRVTFSQASLLQKETASLTASTPALALELFSVGDGGKEAGGVKDADGDKVAGGVKDADGIKDAGRVNDAAGNTLFMTCSDCDVGDDAPMMRQGLITTLSELSKLPQVGLRFTYRDADGSMIRIVHESVRFERTTDLVTWLTKDGVGRAISAWLLLVLLGLLAYGLSRRLPRLSAWSPMVLTGFAATGSVGNHIFSASSEKFAAGVFLSLIAATVGLAGFAGVLSIRFFHSMTPVEPVRSLAPFVMTLHRFRLRWYRDFVAASRKRTEHQGSIDNSSEQYVALPALVENLWEDGSKPTQEAEPATTILKFLASRRDRARIVLIEAGGGFGKSALQRKVVGSLFSSLIDNGGPLPVRCDFGGSGVMADVQAQLGFYAFSDDVLAAQLRQGLIVPVFEDVATKGVNKNYFRSFIETFPWCALILVTREYSELRDELAASADVLHIRPLRLTDDNLGAFVTKYWRRDPPDPALLAGRIKSIQESLRSAEKVYLPVLVRFAALLPDAEGVTLSSIPALYDATLRTLLGGTSSAVEVDEKIEQLRKICVEACWKKQRVYIDTTTVSPEEREFLRSLEAGGLIAPLIDAELPVGEIWHVRFFHDSIQSYLMGMGLRLGETVDPPSEPDWQGFETAVLHPIFRKTEIFEMALRVFARALVPDIEVHMEDMTRAWLRRCAGRISSADIEEAAELSADGEVAGRSSEESLRRSLAALRDRTGGDALLPGRPSKHARALAVFMRRLAPRVEASLAGRGPT